ncbi:hypothetical protein H7I77_25135 [Mycolicibacterium novocastrense]|uniref:Uncharacterized protein n=1 Tax=Mycolicibacterium novocastrense TaxID=59813 RepID=A0AAW5ST17_MYCNV|nr:MULTISPECIES: hypothetical protein [Mycolicibacterium]MCV7026596.1 hypothetical protein [Mycolicibacterium novocastrense]MDX1887467.1 hypothetical protein [Mycolicibacterium sp. 120270]GAT07653.1 uncharacterized protein RMCN_0786 [Mycolicibacterium novocastrense]
MTYQAISASLPGPVAVVGYVRGFPRHPQPGTAVTPFDTAPDGAEPANAELKYALVAVQWATQYTTIDLETGETTSEYRSGEFGTPTGTTWYLAPVDVDDSTNRYQLAGRFAASSRWAALPHMIEVPDAPAEVCIHDHPL